VDLTLGPGNPDPGPGGAVSPAWLHLTGRSRQKTGSGDTGHPLQYTKDTNYLYKWLPQRGPSYMAVMLNMTDYFKRFPLHPAGLFLLSPV